MKINFLYWIVASVCAILLLIIYVQNLQVSGTIYMWPFFGQRSPVFFSLAFRNIVILAMILGGTISGIIHGLTNQKKDDPFDI